MEQAISVRVGCVGWAIPKRCAKWFPATGTHLERYATRFPVVEISSSFYRSHRPATYTRWAAAVPEHFRFAIKLPRLITHVGRLTDTSTLESFLTEIHVLGAKLGLLLVQLPPSLAYDAEAAAAFSMALRDRFGGHVVCEPRHPSWFASEADVLLARFGIARVATDPTSMPKAAEPGGWSGLVYYRLHGSPHMYYSSYIDAYLDALTRKLIAASRSAPVWCIFDNTARGAATENALSVLERLRRTQDS
jgi:uncharacterized protein YecE (DUF72 family)